jgi:hypothetical protein
VLVRCLYTEMDPLLIVLFTAFLALRPVTARTPGTERFWKAGYLDYTGDGIFSSKFLCISQGKVDPGTVVVVVLDIFLYGYPLPLPFFDFFLDY